METDIFQMQKDHIIELDLSRIRLVKNKRTGEIRETCRFAYKMNNDEDECYSKLEYWLYMRKSMAEYLQSKMMR